MEQFFFFFFNISIKVYQNIILIDTLLKFKNTYNEHKTKIV